MLKDDFKIRLESEIYPQYIFPVTRSDEEMYRNCIFDDVNTIRVPIFFSLGFALTARSRILNPSARAFNCHFSVRFFRPQTDFKSEQN